MYMFLGQTQELTREHERVFSTVHKNYRCRVITYLDEQIPPVRPQGPQILCDL
jgi:hypothetical protein